MRFEPRDPPRQFQVGPTGAIVLRDCGRVALDPDEQVTFTTPAGGEYDVVRKPWGFYATPSLNGRLLRFGLRSLLVEGVDGKRFLLLVERGREEELARYLAENRMTVQRWLDDELRCMCPAADWQPLHVYEAPPAGETRFPSLEGRPYRRELVRCAACGHVRSRHAMGLESLYQGEYVEGSYPQGLRAPFERIMALPPERSDNLQRVRRIEAFCRPRLTGRAAPRVLDVGSGLCVFLARMREAGWACTALDPDPRAAAHARDVAGVDAVCGGFTAGVVSGPFELVTFNKVLEHVEDPRQALAQARAVLAPGGLVYVELPDGEAAWAEGPGREEFFIEHVHAFSPASLAFLVRNADLRLLALERLREPSGKYTVWAFAGVG